MGSIALSAFLVVIALVAFFAPIGREFNGIKRTVGAFLFLASVLSTAIGSFSYNDAGYCQHVRTIFSTESATCKTGWYFEGWGRSTSWPQYITVSHTNDPNADSSSLAPPYRVRLADNWVGDVTQTTRFGIPQDEEQFLKMARDFRSPERLITTTLKPAVTASLDSVANLFTMEEYYAGGKRDQFKTEYSDAVEKGRARVHQIEVFTSGSEQSRAAPSNSDVAQDTSDVGDTSGRRIIMKKVTDNSGNDIRIIHDYVSYGITVSSAILENLDPDDRFEEQIQARKDAASRRIVAREERLEQEEQRLLAIQEGETNIAKRQAEERAVQIQATTKAETAKKLALIAAEQQRAQAEIAKQTAEIRLEQTRIDAEGRRIAAEAEAYEKSVILEADGALQAKLAAWVEAQKSWSSAAAQINVPTTVFASGENSGSTGSALGTVDQFMQLMMMKSAKDLGLDTRISSPSKIAQ